MAGRCTGKAERNRARIFYQVLHIADLPGGEATTQRGINENTNGLLRRYFTKGTDLSIHSAEDLETIAASSRRFKCQ